MIITDSQCIDRIKTETQRRGGLQSQILLKIDLESGPTGPLNETVDV